MTPETMGETGIAPERYELADEPVPHRLPIGPDLFHLYGPGLVVLATAASAATTGQTFDVWLHLGEDGQVTVCAGKAEVGQNVRTSIAQAVAEELSTPTKAISVLLGDTDLTPFDIGTFGSRSTPLLIPSVRRAAASAGACLRERAALRWSVPQERLFAHDGQVRDPVTSHTIPYGMLVQDQHLVQIAGADTSLKLASEWTVSGTAVAKLGGHAFVTGEHQYSFDLSLPGMLYGKVLRPPAFAARLNAVDLRAAQDLPGVTVVEDVDFVGVAAPTPARAAQALAAISAEWTPARASGSADDLVSLLRPQPSPCLSQNHPGHHHATYVVPYIAHVPLEPRAAVASWDGSDKLTVWTGTQRPFGVREELALALGLSEAQVRVIVPDTGSGYGGKHTGEAAREAALLARAAGKPVKVTWTREEEFTCAYLRPAGVIDVAATLQADGTLTDWEQHNYNSGAAGLRSPYRVGEQVVEFHETPTLLRQGSYRALAATANHFARESFIDELAGQQGLDPLEFRLRHLEDERLRAVLTAAAERFGWAHRPAGSGRGCGIACGTEKGSYLANCVEIHMDPRDQAIQVTRIVVAYECGAILNPRHLENQVEGATVMGLGGALWEAIHFEGGQITNSRLSEYRVPRFTDLPPVDVVLLDRKDLPSVGAGETPIVAIAPAIANAVFAATHRRLRALPLRLTP